MARGGARQGAGRPKGSVAEHTKQAKQAIEEVFAHLQTKRETSLQTWAEGNLDTFYTHLFPKLLPVQMRHEGQDGGDIKITIATGVPRASEDRSA